MELETFFTVPEQTRLLLYAVLLGIPLGMGFDVLRTLRLLLPHGKLATALEDVSFLLVWAAALLCFSTVLARGEFRGYYWMGSALGFLLYRCTGVVRICTPLNRKFGHFAKLFRKASFFSHLPLQRDRKMLYNDSGILKRKAALSWQRKNKRKKRSHAGSFGSSAGPQ